MITVGIGTKLSDYIKVFTNPAYILIIIATVLGAMIGTLLVGRFFKMYPVEAMLTAGLCMANGGGAGDVQCLGAANRMNMMPYAPDFIPHWWCNDACCCKLLLWKILINPQGTLIEGG